MILLSPIIQTVVDISLRTIIYDKVIPRESTFDYAL
jgi:hypothetical protein